MPRVREIDNRFDSNFEWVETYSGSEHPSGPHYVSTAGVLKTITDTLTPNFHERKNRGEVLLNNLHMDNWSRTVTPGRLETGTYNGYSNVWTGDLVTAWEGALPPLPPHMEYNVGSMEQRVLIKAFAAMKEPVVMGGELVATLSQTVGMLRRPLGNSLELIGKVRRRYRRNLSRRSMSAIQALDGAWLETRYGWAPLLMDISSIIKEARRQNARSAERLVSRATETQERDLVEDFASLSYPPGWNGWIGSGSRAVHSKVRSSAGVIYELRSRRKAEYIADILGLQARDVATTLWELTPYSFVVDWFVNVGDWLKAISPTVGRDILGCWVTSVYDATTVINGGELVYTVPASPTPYNVTGSVGSSTLTTNTVIRTANPSISTYPVSDERTLSLTHAADGVALLSGRIISGLKALARR